MTEEKKTVCIYIGGKGIDGKVYSIRQMKEISPGIDLKPMDGKNAQKRYSLYPGQYILTLNNTIKKLIVLSEDEFSTKLSEYITMDDYQMEGYEIHEWVGEIPDFLKGNI